MRELGIVANGAVLIEDGVIVDAGPARRIEKLPAARRAREIDAAGGVVMPGFVDSHTHLVFGRPRLVDYEMRLAGATYAEIAAAGGGILVEHASRAWNVRRATRSAGARFARRHCPPRYHHAGGQVRLRAG